MLNKIKGVIARNELDTDFGEIEDAVDELNKRYIDLLFDTQLKLNNKIEEYVNDRNYLGALGLANELTEVDIILKRHLEYMAEEDDDEDDEEWNLWNGDDGWEFDDDDDWEDWDGDYDSEIYGWEDDDDLDDEDLDIDWEELNKVLDN